MLESSTANDQTDLIDRIYACVTDVSQWPATLAALTVDRAESRPGAFAMDATETMYRYTRAGTVGSVPLSVAARSLAPHDRLVEVTGTYADGLTAISIGRDSQGASAGAPETVALDRLGSHVVRAFRLQRRLRQVAYVADALVSALDVVTYGIVLLDDRGRVVFTNRAASAIAAHSDDIRLDTHGLSASLTEHRTALQHAVTNALAGRGGSLTIARHGLAALLITAVPLTAAAPLRSAARAAVFITDAAEARSVSSETLRTLFGLTQAECRVAISVAATHRLSTTSATLGISLETGRSHLKRIFDKTDTSRLSEFIRLYERLGAVRESATECPPLRAVR